jgi:hypothetical protein
MLLYREFGFDIECTPVYQDNKGAFDVAAGGRFRKNLIMQKVPRKCRVCVNSDKLKSAFSEQSVLE